MILEKSGPGGPVRGRGLRCGLLGLGLAALCSALASCSRDAEQMIVEGRVDEAVKTLAPDGSPPEDRWDSRVLLGQAYFVKAQRAFESRDELEYTSQMEAAQKELLRAVELAPTSPEAHNLLGILAAYRADLDGARRSFDIASQLIPEEPLFQINLAELEVYRGQISRARGYLQTAAKLGAPPGEVELVEVLAAWRKGDIYAARDIFSSVMLSDPERARTWNGASSIKTFEDMASHCCRLKFCGPYMRDACKQLKKEVAVEDLQRKTLLKEMRLEAVRRKRVAEIYGRRRDLNINLEGDPTPRVAVAPDASAPLATLPRRSSEWDISASTPGQDFFGGDAADKLVGGEGTDYLSGEKGKDRLEGGAGADVLEGGTDDDVLIGGAGNDVYVFSTNTGADIVEERDEKASFDWLFFDAVKIKSLQYERVGNDLRIRAGDGIVTVRGFFAGDTIEWIDGEDGGLSAQDIRALPQLR